MRKFTVVLYDGVCLFCEGWVNFVRRLNSEGHEIYFIPLQSVRLTEYASNESVHGRTEGDTILCITHDGTIYAKSDASLRVMRNLRGWYGATATLVYFVPRTIRNFFYDIIGRNRYRIWGKRISCKIPTFEERKYFPEAASDLPDDVSAITKRYFCFNS